ncbi:MAG: hypothetical protein A2428_06620 [Bdellovibrionales bacterium RIFOXYC1_FULL_54_43]|nr:MAG: hypothetical protein A2428_06620 [Bdellovibrionales bacterium RIFOXYC1_FULL_54_43]
MDLNTLVDRLESVVRMPEIRSGIEDFHREIDEIQNGFRLLPRHEIQADELVSLKFRMQHWRERVLDLVTKYLSNGPSLEDAALGFETLSILELKPERTVLSWLSDWVEQNGGSSPATAPLRASAGRYFATVGEHEFLRKTKLTDQDLVRLAGPATKLPIFANLVSRCTVEKWSKDPEFASYQRDGEGVLFRGIRFLPGDVLICTVNRDGNGIYTALCTPRAYGYHIGIFSMMQREGRELPVVIETYRTGVRAIPLSTFLSTNCISYAEVCRLREIPTGFYAAINRLANTVPGTVKGYNFDTEDPDRSYMACTTVGSQMFESAGAPAILARSKYLGEPRIQRNLAVFDFVLPAFLSPTDFLTDKRMRMVGAVDNHHFDRNIAREIAERHFVKIFRNFELELAKLPVMFALNRWAIRQMRQGTLIGKLIAATHGFTQTNIPKGPEKVLAIIELYEHMLEAAVKHAIEPIRAYRHRQERPRLIDIDRLTSDPAIELIMQKALKPIRNGFNDPELVAADELQTS